MLNDVNGGNGRRLIKFIRHHRPCRIWNICIHIHMVMQHKIIDRLIGNQVPDSVGGIQRIGGSLHAPHIVIQRIASCIHAVGWNRNPNNP